ncbi:MAG: hypothetical protein ACKVUS_03310 [Saprospiraceae bacterium]
MAWAIPFAAQTFPQTVWAEICTLVTALMAGGKPLAAHHLPLHLSQKEL